MVQPAYSLGPSDPVSPVSPKSPSSSDISLSSPKSDPNFRPSSPLTPSSLPSPKSLYNSSDRLRYSVSSASLGISSSSSSSFKESSPLQKIDQILGDLVSVEFNRNNLNTNQENLHSQSKQKLDQADKKNKDAQAVTPSVCEVDLSNKSVPLASQERVKTKVPPAAENECCDCFCSIM